MTYKQLIAKAKQHFFDKKPFVMYQKPSDTFIRAFFQPTSKIVTPNYQESGFVFAPFLEEDIAVFFSKQKCEYYKAKTDISKTEKMETKVDFKTCKQAKKNHIQLVQKGIDFIKKGMATKVVLSRKEEVLLPHSNMFAIFTKMLFTYPRAFVYVWYHPKIGCWLGATPERLLTIFNQKISTMALAGTQLYKNDNEVVWQKKEQEEQQIVTDYIVEKLKSEVKDLQCSKPVTVRAGNLLHLKTDISGELANTSIPSILKLLHPTPAVCGFSTKNATHFIIENENYRRGYYTGFLGEIEMEKTAELFVNLRCMQLQKKDAILYIGGGITAHSNPEKEWEETINKSQTMKKVL